MGNDQSLMSGLNVDEKAVEVSDFWSHHSASLNEGSSTVSVFIGEPLVGGSLWVSQTPLERASKNLMLHRHPCILRYMSSWSKGSKYYLAVENVKPLPHVLQSQSLLQVCIGLHSILKALVFLHERALASHNNVCTASIYVAKDGGWKLGGLEYLCKFKDITKDYMNKSRAHRYGKAIDPNEEKNLASQHLDFIDIYAYAVLVNEVFKNIKGVNDDSLQLNKFLELCKNELHHLDIEQRPKLSSLLEDAFFNHDFITIHSFLVELPLKSDAEKDAFFCSLIDRLRNFKQQIVAKQLGGLLLSRMVLLNKTAQVKMIPDLLSLKENNPEALFDTGTFKQYIVPIVLEIFCVRDAQIRLLLLEYFINFISCFSKEHLQCQILPELLLGIKDTNDQLVAVTLRSLADLVPALGSAIVIGGKRAKFFNDGIPVIHKSSATSRRSCLRTGSMHNLTSATLRGVASPHEGDVQSSSSGTETHADLMLNERPSPDGEEGDTSTITDEGEENQIEPEASTSYHNNDVWDDWDINDLDPVDSPMRSLASHNGNASNVTNLTNSTPSSFSDLTLSLKQTDERRIDHKSVLVISKSRLQTHDNQITSDRTIELPDISELDIKNVKNRSGSVEVDFFQDMEPVINTSNKFLIGEKVLQEDESGANHSQKAKKNTNEDSTFDWAVNVSAEHKEEGWGDDLDAWD